MLTAGIVWGSGWGERPHSRSRSLNGTFHVGWCSCRGKCAPLLGAWCWPDARVVVVGGGVVGGVGGVGVGVGSVDSGDVGDGVDDVVAITHRHDLAVHGHKAGCIDSAVDSYPSGKMRQLDRRWRRLSTRRCRT